MTNLDEKHRLNIVIASKNVDIDCVALMEHLRSQYGVNGGGRFNLSQGGISYTGTVSDALDLANNILLSAEAYIKNVDTEKQG